MGSPAADDHAVAQDGDPVAERQHLLEVVADHEHDVPVGDDPAQQRVEAGAAPRGAGLGSPRRGSSRPRPATVVAQGPGDGDPRPVRWRAARRPGPGVEPAARAVRGPRRAMSSWASPVDAPREPAADEAADADVLARRSGRRAGRGPGGRPRRPPPGPPATGRAVESGCPSTARRHPGVRGVVARQDLDQRGLAGPVLADEGVDLARSHDERRHPAAPSSARNVLPDVPWPPGDLVVMTRRLPRRSGRPA